MPHAVSRPLVLSLLLAHLGLLVPALAVSAFFFLAAQRVAHDAFHRALGLPRRGDHLVLAVLSVMTLGSHHAILVTHLLHHRLCLEEDDLEGLSARMGWLRALLSGPAFFVRKHLRALSDGTSRDRWWIGAELALVAAWVAAVLGVLDAPALRYHVLAMAAGNCLYPFASVWLVHRGCEDSPYLARTLRRRLLNLATLGMLRHAEHHLFPSVPTCRLERLAERIDRAAPEVRRKSVI